MATRVCKACGVEYNATEFWPKQAICKLCAYRRRRDQRNELMRWYYSEECRMLQELLYHCAAKMHGNVREAPNG